MLEEITKEDIEQLGERDYLRGDVCHKNVSKRNENEGGHSVQEDEVYDVSFEDNISEGEIFYDVNKGYLSDGEVYLGGNKWLKSDQDGEYGKYCCQGGEEGDTIRYGSDLVLSDMMWGKIRNVAHGLCPEVDDIDVAQQTCYDTKNDFGNIRMDSGIDILTSSIRTTSGDVSNEFRNQSIEDVYKPGGELNASGSKTFRHEFNSSIPNAVVDKSTDFLSEELNLKVCSHAYVNEKLYDDSVSVGPTSPVYNGGKKNILIKFCNFIRKKINKN